MRPIHLIFLILIMNSQVNWATNPSQCYSGLNLFLKNPGVGCIVWPGIDKQPDYFKPYINGLYARPSWSDVIKNGKIDFDILAPIFQEAYKYKKRIDIGIFFNLSMNKDSRSRLGTEMYNGKEVYIGYPKEIHEQLMSSKKYKPRLVYVPDTDTYWYCIDWRNPIAQKEYKKLLVAFNQYLNEPWHEITRRKYINSIQIRFWGFWGEGHNNYLIAQNKGHDDVFEDSKSMIAIDKFYIKLFHDIRLIAPAMGKTSNIPGKWKTWALYELTAHNDVGDFGIFIDHISKNSKGDFTLIYNGVNTQNIALNKWKQAPVTGEGNIINNAIPGRGNEIYRKDNFPIEEYDIPKYHISSFLSVKSNYSKDEMNIFDELIRRTGYRLYFINPQVIFQNNLLKIRVAIGNMGFAPLYSNYWKIQFVIRNNKGEIQHIINPKTDLRNIKIGHKAGIPLLDDCLIIAGKYKVSNQGRVFLRIIDKDGIAENMNLYNEGRTINGEYSLN